MRAIYYDGRIEVATGARLDRLARMHGVRRFFGVDLGIPKGTGPVFAGEPDVKLRRRIYETVSR